MDEMRLRNGILTRIISKIISKNISKKIGQDCKVSVNALDIVNNGTKTNIHLVIDGEIDTAKIPEILKQFGVV